MKREKPIISTRSQDREYNCGAFAAKFVLELFGIPSNVRDLEKQFLITEKDGTHPKNMAAFFTSLRFNAQWRKAPAGMFSHVPFPSIVLYRHCRDDHYGVLISSKDQNLTMYDPAHGKLETMPIAAFVKNWWTRRYGKGLFLPIALNA